MVYFNNRVNLGLNFEELCTRRPFIMSVIAGMMGEMGMGSWEDVDE